MSALAPERVAFAAGRLLLRRLRDLASKGAEFAFESTLAGRSFAPWIGSLQRTGYEFHLIYLYLSSADLAVARVKERVRAGGHDVAERDVRRRYKRSLQNFFTLYRPLADSWLLLDNSAHPTPVPVAWRNIGGPIHIVRDRLWKRLREAYEK